MRWVREGRGSGRATTDDLQGLLLQVVFALLMIFMLAYFIFVGEQKRERAEEVMAVNRQKLTLALERVAEEHRVRYGLNALMTQGTDGTRTFEPDAFVRHGKIELAPAARKAFAGGARAAWTDYRDTDALTANWRTNVLAAAGLADADLGEDERTWLADAVRREVDAVRLDARGVQRSLAARLQRQWIENPKKLGGVSDPLEIAETLKGASLKLVAEAIRQDGGEGEVLP